MAITLHQRMTRFLRKNKGVCPPEYRDLYKRWRGAEDQQAALELLDQVETQDERDDDALDREEHETLLMASQPVMFGVSKPSVPPVAPVKKTKKAAKDGSTVTSAPADVRPDEVGGVEGDSGKTR